MNVRKGIVIILVLCSVFIIVSTIYAQQKASTQGQVVNVRTRAGINWWIVLESGLYAIMGIVLSLLAYKLYDLLTPFSLNKELSEDQNIAVGILIGAIFIGIAMIIAASIF